MRCRHAARAAAIACAILMGAALPPRAHAHAYLVGSSPAARGVVAQAPSRVELWFNERLEQAYADVSVWSAAGRRVDRGNVRVEEAEPRRLSVGVVDLGPGVYTVRYRVVSVDGHVVEAQFTFTVRGMTTSPAR